MARFLVLPRDPEGAFADVSPAEMQSIVERYTAWTRGLAERGALQAGEKLVDGQARVLRPGEAGPSVTDGPFTEAKEVIGGMWIVEADDLDDATELVRDCPHLEYGSLELRQIEELGAPEA